MVVFQMGTRNINSPMRIQRKIIISIRQMYYKCETYQFRYNSYMPNVCKINVFKHLLMIYPTLLLLLLLLYFSLICISRVWRKTILTTCRFLYVTSNNSFAPNPRFVLRVSVYGMHCTSRYIH